MVSACWPVCAVLLFRGKHLATYSPSMDMGSYVVVINADKVKVTGNKANDKTYFRHVNGRPGSWKIETFTELQRVSVLSFQAAALCMCRSAAAQSAVILTISLFLSN